MDYKQLYAIKKANQKRILKACPTCPNVSGIYILTREEHGIKYGYVGQAKHILDRLVEHLSGYQHIDISLKKHGLWAEDNPAGYRIYYVVFDGDLDEHEQDYIREYANKGYQLRNKTVGGQGEGKAGMDNAKPSRGYHDGLKQGYLNAQRDVAKWMKHLEVSVRKDGVNARKAFDKFNEFLGGEEQ